jgi:hypothetical protein
MKQLLLLSWVSAICLGTQLEAEYKMIEDLLQLCASEDLLVHLSTSLLLCGSTGCLLHQVR